ncbi:MAG: hypothetical protein RL011_1937 [Pseudomonadota bacterium]|jgi:hypothetical protein
MKNVRLTPEELDGIVTAAIAVFGVNLLQIRLYGSRTDPFKSGGDIDLVFELRDQPVDKFLMAQKLRLELSSRLGEQKFDMLILSEYAAANTDRENQFFNLIMSTSKIIWTSDHS